MKQRNAGHLLATTSGLALALALAQPAAAADVTWTGAAGTAWTSGGSWTGGAAPTSADAVTINSVTTGQDIPGTILGVTGAENAAVGSLSIGLVETGYWDGDLLIQNGSTLAVTGGVSVGATGGVGAIEADGKLVINTGSKLTMGGALFVGDGWGEMVVSNNSSVTVDASWTVIGRYGTGKLDITNQSTMTSAGSAFVGEFAGATGTVNVTGAGSKWTVGGPLNIGMAGTGTVNIQNGGTVTAKGGTTVAGSSTGTLNIASNGVLETTALTRGAGNAQVNLNGGMLRALSNNENFIDGFTGDDFYIGGSNGTIDTNGFNVTASSEIAGAGALIKTGNGTLTLTGNNTYANGTAIYGGKVSVASDANLGAPTGGIWLNNGGTLENTGAFTTTARNVVLLANGGTFETDANLTLTGVISGPGSLTKTGGNTLTLTGNNTYAGGTIIKSGFVSVSSDANLGAATGGITLDNGWLRNTGAFTSARNVLVTADNGGIQTDANLTLTGVVSGDGYLVKTGDATLTLAGDNTYAGITDIRGGTVQIGNGGASGSVASDVMLRGTSTKLAFNRSDVANFNSVISGTGSVEQIGSGTTVLSGANTYTGATNVKAGTLKAGAADILNTTSGVTVDTGATLDLAGYNQTLKTLSNAGNVRLGNGAAGTTLTVTGDYVGNGGTIYLDTVLGGDNSATDRLVVEGSTSGTGVLAVTNRGGLGAQTVEGIKLVDVGVASDGQFSLQGDYAVNGEQAVVGGAYVYQLHQGGVTDPNDGDWYLRSATTETGDPLYQAGVPVYEALGGAAQQLNGVGTLQQRVGNRYWSGAANPVIAQGDGPAEATPAPEAGAATETATTVWGRIEGSHGRFEPESTTGSKYDVDTYKMQAGVDGKLYENEAGSVIGGVTVHYGNAKADISSGSGDGTVDIDGYGVGGTLTWYGDNGLYVDGQAQATWYQSDLGSDTANRTLAEGNDGFGYALSVETGKRFAIDPHWTLTPQAQLSWSSVEFDGFTDTFGVGVSQDADESLKGRLGIAAEYGNGWMGADGKKVQTTVYAIANLHHEFMDGSKTYVDGVAFTSKNDRTWGGIGTGGTYSWADGKYALYGEVSVDTSLENFADSYKVNGNAGLKVSW
ncbi:outer membrane autotransporter protein [Phyllobacterium leguminum]|uniref:Outer membrane autotransporter protein n=2 Tax=Phyllobacterium leguminum TaxID=314237 RepID=A0A318T6N3_9HYPH|nr:outer membrane autotransporter protein [Phyllobacterium leguminum]